MLPYIAIEIPSRAHSRALCIYGIYNDISDLQSQINNKTSIDDNSTSSISYTYSVKKINELLNNKISSNTIISVSNGGTGYNTITDTTYTTARYRASSLNSSETTPTENGVIAWTYE